MYVTKATINGLEETAVYPIVVTLAQDLLGMLGLDSNTPIRIGDNPPLRLSKDAQLQNTHIPDIPDNELFIEYNEAPTDDYNVALTGLMPTLGHIYRDPDIRSFIQPINIKQTMVLSITYFGKSKSKVNSVVSRLRYYNMNNKGQLGHDLEYFYYMPDVVMLLLDELNTLKNTHTVPKLDFDTYVGNTFRTQANVVNSEDGDLNKVTLAIRSKQQSALGTMDTDGYTLTKNKDDETNRWSISLDYTVTYELPSQLLVSYPMVVYNQLISKPFRLSNIVNKPDSIRSVDSKGLALLTNRNPELLSIPDGGYYLRVPFEDNVTLPKPDPGYIRLLSAITIIDVATPTELFYLDEIPGISLKPEVLALFKLEAPRVTDKYKSIFHVEIFDYDRPLYTHKVLVTVVTQIINGVSTERVQLTTNLPLDIKGNYRISINILTDLTVLPTTMLDLLKANIASVDALSIVKFSVIDSVVGVLNLDKTMINPELVINHTITSMDIALNITNDIWHRVFTKQVALILTEALILK